MAEIYFQGRTKEKRDTDANFTSSNIVLLDGEVVIVDMPDGEVRRKIGDGVTPYGQLPFDDEVVREKIDGLAEKIGDLDQLDTTAKADLVAAINEVAASSGGGFEDLGVVGYKNNLPDIPIAIRSGAYKFKTSEPSPYSTYGTVFSSQSGNVLYDVMIFKNGIYARKSMDLMDAEWIKIATSEDITDVAGDLDDLATNEKTNLVGAINELADFDEFTLLENNYNIFTTSKRNVFVIANSNTPEGNVCEINGTDSQVITVYNSSWKGSTKDVVVVNILGGGEVTIAIGESHTFLYSSGYLQDLGMVAAQSIDYGNDNNFTRMSKPAKRYFVQVPETDADTTTIQISNLDLTRDKKYYIHACVCSDVTNTIRLEAFDGMMSVWGYVTTDGVMTDVFGAGNFGSFSTAYNDIVLFITGVLEPDYMMDYVKCELDITYGDLSLNEIHHRKISTLMQSPTFVKLTLSDERFYFLEKSFIEITTV